MNKYLKFTITLFFFINTQLAHANWQLHDVSILFPLPPIGGWDQLLSPTSQDNILPFEVFQNAQFLINQPNEKTYPDLRVVAVRIDPCFQEGAPATPCQKQLRLVWQPLTNLDGKTSTIDASLHVFFNLNSDEFSKLSNHLQSWKQKHIADHPTSQLPLGVHPALQKAGLMSPMAIEFKNIILESVQNKNIARLTFMKLKGMNDMWFFGGVDFKKDGSKKSIQIPLLIDTTEQEFINELAIRAPARQFFGGIFPSADETSLFSELAKDSSGLDVYKEEDVKKMVQDFANFENPSLHNPGTLDCVGCHLSNTMRSWAELNFPNFNLKSEFEKFSYKNSNFDLRNLNDPKGRADNLRMFGYLNDLPITNQRVINESAEVATQMNQD